jgi:hypothetical protein
MLSPGSEIDANFYRLIHQMLTTPRKDELAERRSEKRHDYRAAQWIAPWDGSKFPGEEEFVPIQCRDLTRSGFSFLAATEPRFAMMVAQFGTPPDVMYVGAQVLHSVPVICYSSGLVVQITGRTDAATLAAHPNERGKPMFLVGCRFTRRLQNPD